MPAESLAQYRLMQAAANDPALAQRLGITQAAAREFINRAPNPAAPAAQLAAARQALGPK